MARSKISEQELDHNNDVWRTTPLYQEALRAVGANPNGPIRLSESQRKRLHQYVAERGMVLPHGTEFDPAGNVNRDDRGFAESGLGKTLIAAGAIGASMFIPGVAPAVFGALGGGGGAAGGGALASSSIPTSLAMTAVPGAAATGIGVGATTAATTAATLASNPSTWRRIADFGRDNKDLFRAGGSMLSAASQSSASNRGVQIDVALEQEKLRQQAERDYQDANLRREQEGRVARGDAWKQLQQAQYVQSATGKAPGFSTYSRDIAAPTDVERQAASGLEAEVMKRLMEGNQLPEIPRPSAFTVPNNLTSPSAFERIAGYVGPGLATFGNLDNLRNRRS